MKKEKRHSARELGSRVVDCGYKDADDFFKRNPVTPFVVLAREVGVAYQTISRHYKEWKKGRG
ncbi:MAG: hypothetical protein HQK96_01480 [Nitrospirae bacterium]|nr:hypothetical protein [Nitrospirota bacterium]